MGVGGGGLRDLTVTTEVCVESWYGGGGGDPTVTTEVCVEGSGW